MEFKITPKCEKEAITFFSEHNANDKLRVLIIGFGSVVREDLQSNENPKQLSEKDVRLNSVPIAFQSPVTYIEPKEKPKLEPEVDSEDVLSERNVD